MDDPIERLTARSLAEYAQALRSIRPSAKLDARLHEAIRSFDRRARRSRRVRLLAMAAGLGALVAGAAMLVAPLGVRENVAGVRPVQLRPTVRLPDSRGNATPLPGNRVAAWPGDAAVFRVRISSATWAQKTHFDGGQNEPQFWADVLVGQGGSMQVVRIIPVAGRVAVPHDYSPIDVLD